MSLSYKWKWVLDSFIGKLKAQNHLIIGENTQIDCCISFLICNIITLVHVVYADL